jgi:heme O synthase-like polyprenyltransferase
MLGQYLLLIRVPNLFTVPSNILSGYFATTLLGEANIPQLLLLIFSSIFLYAAGTILNDYFDINVDRKERPNRPLASGQITKRNALLIATSSIVAGNILSWSVSWNSFIISFCLTIVIFIYNYWLKRNRAGNPLTMGSARFLNVLLGGSSALGLVTKMDLTLVFVGYCLFLYTVSISLLSLKEVSTGERLSNKAWIPIVLSFLTVLLTIGSILVAGFSGYFQMAFIFNLIIFSCIMCIGFFHLFSRLKRITNLTSQGHFKEGYPKVEEERVDSMSQTSVSREIQRKVKTMILSIVVLDSIFLSGLIGIYAGIAVLLLVIPPILLGRKLYVT